MKFPVLLIRDVYPGSWIPDPNFFHPRSRILDQKFFASWIPDPGSEFFSIPDPGSRVRIKNLSIILTKKMVSKLSEI
jgi:hypothetical protein